MNNLKLSKSVIPEAGLDQETWIRQYSVGSMYTKPTQYFQNNDFNANVFAKRHTSVLDEIINFFKKTKQS